jgi:hypothetical protein
MPTEPHRYSFAQRGPDTAPYGDRGEGPTMTADRTEAGPLRPPDDVMVLVWLLVNGNHFRPRRVAIALAEAVWAAAIASGGKFGRRARATQSRAAG